MNGADHGAAALGQPQQAVHHILRVEGVEARGGLVAKHQPRVADLAVMMWPSIIS